MLQNFHERLYVSTIWFFKEFLKTFEELSQIFTSVRKLNNFNKILIKSGDISTVLQLLINIVDIIVYNTSKDKKEQLQNYTYFPLELGIIFLTNITQSGSSRNLKWFLSD